jgi:hypothetical protein
MVAPIAGGAGTSPSARALKAKAAPAITNNVASKIDKLLFIIYKISFNAESTD